MSKKKITFEKAVLICDLCGDTFNSWKWRKQRILVPQIIPVMKRHYDVHELCLGKLVEKHLARSDEGNRSHV